MMRTETINRKAYNIERPTKFVIEEIHNIRTQNALNKLHPFT